MVTEVVVTVLQFTASFQVRSIGAFNWADAGAMLSTWGGTRSPGTGDESPPPPPQAESRNRMPDSRAP